MTAGRNPAARGGRIEAGIAGISGTSLGGPRNVVKAVNNPFLVDSAA